MQVQGVSAVVTGAASGLGRATAAALLAAGARVAVIDLPGTALDTLGPGALMPVPLDVTDGEGMEAAFAAITARHGRPRILVNCAGVLAPARVFRIDKATGRALPRPMADLRRVIDVNLTGTFNTIRLFTAGLSDETGDSGADSGVIVNTASVAAFEALSGQAGYGASKAGVAAMTLPLARELARFGIRVVAVAPGSFDTGVFERVPPRTQAQLIADVPFPRRAGRPEEFASLVLEILRNQMLNGAVLRLDGGVRMREPVAAP
jgi:NAD(P)-dependent dehydrogenase (short-subunit alcohol dehydrogenase family)